MKPVCSCFLVCYGKSKAMNKVFEGCGGSKHYVGWTDTYVVCCNGPSKDISQRGYQSKPFYPFKFHGLKMTSPQKKKKGKTSALALG